MEADAATRDRSVAEHEAASMTEPEVIVPDQEPDDDTEAEVPDVREDTVPE